MSEPSVTSRQNQNRWKPGVDRSSFEQHYNVGLDHWPMHATHSKITSSAIQLPLLNEGKYLRLL